MSVVNNANSKLAGLSGVLKDKRLYPKPGSEFFYQTTKILSGIYKRGNNHGIKHVEFKKAFFNSG